MSGRAVSAVCAATVLAGLTGCGGGSGAKVAQPAPVRPSELAALGRAMHQPIYWAGGRAGATYGLTRSGAHNFFVRYDINPEFSRTDVSLVIGANDVTNPAAKTQPDSPIFGMPILEVDKSASTIVLKRSMSSGFAGVDNPLFYDPKTSLLFGDAKKSVSEVTAEVQAL
jgi:hypothetical protein